MSDEHPKGILTHNQFQKKLSALQELFEVDLEGIQRAIFNAQKNGHVPTAIVLPQITVMGLPLKMSPTVTRVTIEAHGINGTEGSLGPSTKSS